MIRNENTVEISIKLFDAMRSALSICEPDACVSMNDIIDDKCKLCWRLDLCLLMAEEEKHTEEHQALVDRLERMDKNPNGEGYQG